MEKLSADIFIKILEYLPVQDQLNAAEVCEYFHKLIKKSIFKKKYKEIEVFKTDQHYIVSNKLYQRFNDNEKIPQFLITAESRCLLRPEEFITFLIINCTNLKTFSLVLNKKYNDNNNKYYKDLEYLKDIQFKNLLHLHYQGLNIAQNDYIQWLNLSYPNLEGLYLNNCRMNEELIVSTLKKINNLKMLKIENENEYTINYKTIKSLVAEEKLKTLRLNVSINDFTEEDSLETDLMFASSIENLTIGCFEYENTLWAFNSNSLKHLNNLRDLTLITANNFFIMEEFFTSLNTVCKHLESLSLQRCNIKNFIAISTLKRLEFRNCFGLTWQDFRTILTEMNLKSFSSLASRYKGEIECFNINPSLEHISLHYNILNKIKNIFHLNENRLENLSSLNWSVDFTKQLWLNPINCPNLEMLKARTKNISTENLMAFKSLKYLSLDVSEDFQLMDLLSILQHRYLQTVSCTFVKLPEFIKSYTDELMNFKTKLRNLNLCFVSVIPCEIMDLWINLLRKNTELTLRIEHSSVNFNVEFLTYICDNATFRENLNINICGLNVGK